jgi:tRNA (guanosine-2'-O-)-methyltransferase
MRRTTAQTLRACELGDRLAARILDGEIDAERVVGVLEPYASPERRTRLREVFARRLGSVTVVLDALHDPHNGAAVLRTCDALGIARVHLVERGEAFLAHAAVARGTHKWVQVVAHASAAGCVAALTAEGFVLASSHPEGHLVPADLAAVPRLALVMGNEHEGIAPDLLRACELSVRVPMRGFVESLNVSVSFAILASAATAGREGDLTVPEQRRLYARGLALSVPNAAALLEAHLPPRTSRHGRP